MKLVMDEKLKHRLVGACVILSLGAIFLPAMMKKSSQRLESNFSVNVELPPKPAAANVAITDEDQMFKTIKIAKVELPSAQQAQTTEHSNNENSIASAPLSDDALVPVAKIETASIEKPLELALNDAVKTAVKKEIMVAANKPAKSVSAAIKVATAPIKPKSVIASITKKPAAKKEIYAVQLASFSKLGNAQALVSKLQSKGYRANYTRSAARNGVIYKVYVGHSPIKTNVVKLKTQLANAMQLNGFVVNTGVS